MDTKTKPLLSDERMGHLLGRKAVRDIYEADRQKTRAVVQACVDALADPHKMSLGAEAPALAAELNITPKP